MAAEVEFRLSGGAANADPNASLGSGMSATSVDSGVTPNLFDNVGTQEGIDGSDKYRCIYVTPQAGKNYVSMGIWISTPTLSNSSKLYVGVAPEGKNAAAELIADEDTAPVNVIFTRPTQSYSTLALPDLNVGDFIAVWIKRTISVEAEGYDNDYGRLTVEGAEV